MPITFVRIDDRLIHGQVVEGWLKYLSIDHILVISDSISGDPIQKTLLTIAVPQDTRVTILNLQEAVEWLQRNKNGSEKIMILTAGPEEILQIVERGIPLDSVNVGGLHRRQQKLQISPAVSLSERDCQILKKISENGVELEVRAIPTEKPLNIVERIAQAKFFSS